MTENSMQKVSNAYNTNPISQKKQDLIESIQFVESDEEKEEGKNSKEVEDFGAYEDEAQFVDLPQKGVNRESIRDSVLIRDSRISRMLQQSYMNFDRMDVDNSRRTSIVNPLVSPQTPLQKKA